MFYNGKTNNLFTLKISNNDRIRNHGRSFFMVAANYKYETAGIKFFINILSAMSY